LPPLLKPNLAQFVAFETQNVEGDERGLRPVAPGYERAEVARPVARQTNRLAVDQRLARDEDANRPQRGRSCS
jgi:hypothetical protein